MEYCLHYPIAISCQFRLKLQIHFCGWLLYDDVFTNQPSTTSNSRNANDLQHATLPSYLPFKLLAKLLSRSSEEFPICPHSRGPLHHLVFQLTFNNSAGHQRRRFQLPCIRCIYLSSQTLL